MKQNPFYGLSAIAMLGGCYLLSHALKVVPGQPVKIVEPGAQKDAAPAAPKK